MKQIFWGQLCMGRGGDDVYTATFNLDEVNHLLIRVKDLCKQIIASGKEEVDPSLVESELTEYHQGDLSPATKRFDDLVVLLTSIVVEHPFVKTIEDALTDGSYIQDDEDLITALSTVSMDRVKVIIHRIDDE